MKTRTITIFLTLLLLIFSQNLVSQSYQLVWKPDSTGLYNHFDIDSITVSGSKRTSTLMNTPISVTSLSGLRIERERLTNLTTLTARIPNLHMPDYGSKLTAPIYIRGIGSRINEPSVGLYVDDVAVFDKSGYNFDLFNIKRIEVLRGPQGTLYGRNTMGGIIHIQTKEPGDIRETNVGLDLAGYGTAAIKFSHFHPLVSNKLSMEISGVSRTRSGFYTNGHLDEKVDRIRSVAGRVKLLYKPGKNTTVQWIANTDISREGGYPYGLLNLKDDSLARPEINYDHKSYYHRDMLSTSLKIDQKISNLRLTGVVAYQFLNDDQDIDQDFTPKDLLAVSQLQKQNLLTTEVNLRSPDNRRFEWITGVYGFRQLMDRRVDVGYGQDAIPVYRLPATQTRRKDYAFGNTGAAMYAQFTLRDILLKGLDMTMGIRADHEKGRLDYHYEILMNGITTPQDNFDHSASFFELLPKWSLQYRAGSSLMMYTSIGKGYKSGGFNSTFERTEDQTFDSESSWNYEAGVKVKSPESHWMINLSGFYIDWSNQQIYQPVPSGQGSMLKNAGKTSSKGFELESSVVPFRNFTANLSCGYTHAMFIDYVANPAKGINYNGNMIPYVPRYNWFTGATYRLPLKGRFPDEIHFSLSYQGTGKLFWNDANSLHQSPYQLLGARIEVHYRDFSVALWGSNLLGTHYNVFLFQALGNTYAQPGQPRLLGISLNAGF
jgi:iron complex outermembrane recepter protein